MSQENGGNQGSVAALARVRAMFDSAPFVRSMGIGVTRAEEGVCESILALAPDLLQQSGVAHAGVIATLADHTAGGAAMTVLPEGKGVLSIEFKVNLLRPGEGEQLACRATVLKSGRTISVAEAEVFAVKAGERKLAAKATVTLAIVDWSPVSGRR